jgi:hypothetical protein
MRRNYDCDCAGVPDHGVLKDVRLNDVRLEDVFPEEAEDPWQHRSENMRCYSCMYYVAKRVPNDEDRNEIGRCRRHAPTMSGFPVVYPFKDWCGDHKLDERAI